MNGERVRPVAADIRSRVIADCAALLPLARDACAAMDEEDEAEVLRLFCGESQKRTLRRLGRLIDDLRLCRTAEDLPGQEPVVLELRNAAFRVFRGLSVRVGNPLDLTKLFRSGAVDFFRMLVRRDPMLLQLVRRGLWRRFAYGLLFAALKANQCLLKLRQMPAAFLRPFLVLTTGTGRIFRSVRSVRKRADELSQEQVARDFGITRMAVYRWEKHQTADGPDNTSNKFGYYRGLRTNPELRGAYAALVQCARHYHSERQKAIRAGRRFVTFTRFREEWLKHQH